MCDFCGRHRRLRRFLRKVEKCCLCYVFLVFKSVFYFVYLSIFIWFWLELLRRILKRNLLERSEIRTSYSLVYLFWNNWCSFLFFFNFLLIFRVFIFKVRKLLKFFVGFRGYFGLGIYLNFLGLDHIGRIFNILDGSIALFFLVFAFWYVGTGSVQYVVFESGISFSGSSAYPRPPWRGTVLSEWRLRNF